MLTLSLYERREIPGFPGYYIDTLSKVWRKLKTHTAIKKHGPFRELKQNPAKNGYYYVSLCVNETRKECPIHRLMLETFVCHRPSGNHVCRHLDGNPKNNSLINLCWGTYKENYYDGVKHGTRNHAIGTRIACAKLTPEKVREIRRLYASGGYLQKTLADMYGVTDRNISSVVLNQTWKHVE